jgi:hypothetical protein
MFLVEFFSLDSAAPARLPVAKSVSTREANNDDAQGRKNMQDETKHLNKAR